MFQKGAEIWRPVLVAYVMQLLQFSSKLINSHTLSPLHR